MLGRVLAISCAFWAFLCGLWLALSPFVLGPKPAKGNWPKAAIIDIATGSAIALVAMFTIIALLKSLTSILRADGHLAPRPNKTEIRKHPDASGERVADPQLTTMKEQAPSNSESSTVDLPIDANAILTPLITALAEDLAHRPGSAGSPIQHPTFPLNTPSTSAASHDSADRNGS